MMNTPHQPSDCTGASQIIVPRSLPLIFFTLALGNAAEALEVCSAGFMLQRATDDPAGQTAIAVGVFIGMLLGGFVSGVVADTIGRIPALRWSLTLSTVASAAAAFAPGIGTFVVLRVLAGTGVGAATPPLFALATELAPPGKSGPAVALVATFWMVGSVIAAGLAAIMLTTTTGRPPSFGADEPWRPFAFACAGVPAVSTTLVWTVLAPAQRATPSATLGGAGAGETDASPTLGTTGAALGHVQQSLSGVLRTLADPASRRALYPLMLVWFGLNFGSYGLSTWLTALLANAGVHDPYRVALLYSVAMLPGNLFSIFAVDALGRRPLLVGAMLLSALSAVALGAVDARTDEGRVILAACAFSACSNAGWNALNALSTESFAAEVRATAFSVLAASGRVASIGSQFVNGALSRNPPVLLSVTSAFMVLGCAGALMVRPTSGLERGDHARLTRTVTE